MAHLFNYSGHPWLTQKWVRKVKSTTFGDTTAYGGYTGDEDQGQMGALSALMAIGMFEVQGVAAAEPRCEITSPIFDQVTILLHNKYYSSTFTIKTIDNSDDNMYMQSARFDGELLHKWWLSHQDFADGGTLLLEMGPEPSKQGLIK